jgi:uncharacterized protein
MANDEVIGRTVSMQSMLDRLGASLAGIPQVKFAYLFGSHARGDAGPLSDLDIAVFLDRRLAVLNFRLQLIVSLTRVLGVENFDLVTLNDASVVLKYEVIRAGRVVKEDRKRRVPFEVEVLREYLDTAHLRHVQGLYLKEQFSRFL